MKLLKILKHFFKEYQLPILSGVLIGTSYIPFPPWASLFGLVPLWLFWLQNPTRKKIIISGWISQFILTAIGFSWIAYNIHEFGAMPWAVSILGMIIFCSFANYYIPFAGWVWFELTRKNKKYIFSSILLLGLLTALFETYFQTIFKWNFAYTWMWSRIPLYQWSEFIGFQGLSSFIILCNAFLLWLWLQRKESKTKYYFISFLGVLLSLIIWGHQLPKRWKNADAIIRPLIIQANIPNQQKVYAEKGIGFRSVILNKFLQMTHEAHTSMSRPDFAIWPETAFPEYLNLPFGEHTEKLNAYIRQQTLPLITGGYSKHPNRQTSNSLFFINEEGEFSDMPYHKSILLAFGEYIPGAEKFPQLKKWLPMVADFKRGEGPQVRNFLNIKVGPQICYESLYPEFSWGLVNSGAEVIVNVTNDSWFGWWQEPYQHMIMTLARGIEFRRPVIRSTNTGISTVMLATGEQLKQSPIGQEWAHTFIVPYKTKPELTFYAKTFNLIPNLIIMAIFFILLFFRIKKYKDQKQSFKRFM